MKAYITKWYERGYRISEDNFGGSKEIEIPPHQYSLLLQMQGYSDKLQKELARLSQSE